MALRGIVLKEELFKNLHSSAEKVLEYRNLLAHGAWRREGGEWKVQQTRGDYRPEPPLHDSRRVIAPEAFKADLEGLRSIVREIETLIGNMRTLDKALPAELPPWRDKRPPKGPKPKRQRKSSGEAG
jgi:hypothetical protein